MLPMVLFTLLIIVGGWFFFRGKRPFKKPLIPNQQKDVVYFFTLGDFYDRPHASPFCLKLETFLRLHKIKYQTIKGINAGPTGKWPWIVYNDEVVTDSTFAITFLENKFGINWNTEEVDKALGHVIHRMIEEHLYWVLVYERWVDPTIWSSVVRCEYFKTIPFLIRYPLSEWLLRPKIISSLHGTGTTRLPKEEMYKKGFDDIDSLSIILGSKPYFFGNSISRADLTIYSMLDCILAKKVNGRLGTYTRTKENLVSFVHRVHALAWTDFPAV